MTTTDWLSGTDPTSLLRHAAQRADPRLSRLFVVACCRRVWDLLAESQCCRRAVDLGEAFADGAVTAADLQRAHSDCVHFAGGFAMSQAPAAASYADLGAVLLDVPGMISNALAELEEIGGIGPDPQSVIAERTATERAAQCELLRDIFGADLDWSASAPCQAARQHGTVQVLAHRLYDERSFEMMPALGESLETVGCADELVLKHCRQSGLHVRGCWVVDWVLDKR